ncbi:MAG: 1,4-dihydroxy-6-naphthoate synthase [Acidobacteriota bacterium]|nr:1,4-dihydroxy-6-naphthoate synthase [Acidobacteriota bacterium]
MLSEQVTEFKLQFGKLLKRADLRSDKAGLTEHLRALLTTFDLPTTREGLVKRRKSCKTPPVRIADGSWSNGGWGAYGVTCFYDIGWCPTLNALLLKEESVTGEDTYWGIPARTLKSTRVLSLDSLADFIIWRGGEVLWIAGTRPPPKLPAFEDYFSDMIRGREKFMHTAGMTETRTITVAHSPDSDDAFMFYGLATGKIDTGDLKFEHVLEDIQTLNEKATHGIYDVTAVSFHAYAYIFDKYVLLPHGASIGDGYGPIVVAREPYRVEDLVRLKIAVPGTMTSAFLALRILAPEFEYEVVPFDQIIDAVREGRADAGLLIHEGQLFYQNLGLHKVVDLGEWWKEWTDLPLPMGGNVIHRDLGAELISRVSAYLHESIQYSLDNRRDALAYAMQFARDMDTELADRFVEMWVNQLTLDYTERGRRAVQRLLDEGAERGIIPRRVEVEFVG